jgi:hypothetical protein
MALLKISTVSPPTSEVPRRQGKHTSLSVVLKELGRLKPVWRRYRPGQHYTLAVRWPRSDQIIMAVAPLSSRLTGSAADLETL